METQADIESKGHRAINRLALTTEDNAIRDWFVDQLEEAGLTIRVDELGNIFGRREGTDPNAKPVLLGSHLDSQPNGGIYDGALGIIAALEFIHSLNDREISTRRPIEIVNWTNEEGSRFEVAMMASGVWGGAFELDEIYGLTDEDGIRVEDELERIGYKGSVPVEPQEPYEAYIELHVEQGPRLEANESNVGVVTGVVGFHWGAATFTGEADHAGPTPMHHRQDALVAAADLITNIRRIPGSVGERTVGTVGVINGSPNSINVIPSEVTVTWDTRDPDDENVNTAVDRIKQEAKTAAAREGVQVDLQDRMQAPSIEFDNRVIDAVEESATALGYDSMRMLSGAGHDATYVADVCDTGMVFAVSENGKSHSPAEYTSWDDCYAAANTLASAALTLSQSD
jgi:N-carbamoyl-L-amino-acid hydrolase